MTNTNLFNRLKVGIKKGWTQPTLPDHLIKLQLNPLIRIFRVLGGISLLLILSKKINYFSSLFFYIAFLIVILYSFYLFYITFYRIKHIKMILKNKDLEIRNSPLDKFATYAGKLIFCAKGACDTVAPIGVVLGIMAGFDTILEHKGREPIFLPFIADVLIPDSEQEKIFKDRKKYYYEMSKTNNKFKLLEEDKTLISQFENSKLFNSEDIKTMKESLITHEKELISNKDELVKKITENLSNFNSKK